MIVLPAFDTADFQYTVPLDGIVVRVRFHYALREDAWYADLMDAQGVALALGAVLRPGFALFGRKTDGMPPGRFIVVDRQNGTLDRARRDDLGNRVVVLYGSAAEVAALPASVPEEPVIGLD